MAKAKVALYKDRDTSWLGWMRITIRVGSRVVRRMGMAGLDDIASSLREILTTRFRG